MESPETAGVIPTKSRIVLVLGKFPVVERTETAMKIALGGSTTMTVTITSAMDVKSGDFLTLYTEVLYAQPSQPRVQ